MLSYAYFEERVIDSQARWRRRNVAPAVAPGAKKHVPSSYPYWNTRALEGSAFGDPSEGVWPINHWRAERMWGDPGLVAFPDGSGVQQLKGLAEQAKAFRLHHYFRARSAKECAELIKVGCTINLSLEIGPTWIDPPNGYVGSPFDDSPVLASHAVPLIDYDRDSDQFVFRNSWGESWGHRGFGVLPASAVENRVVEAWVCAGHGMRPPIRAKRGIVFLLWSCDIGDRRVHGREVLNAGTGERIAWAFCLRHDDFLDVEEFYVAPSHQGRGYGRFLAKHVRELSELTRLPLRAWISIADAGSENREKLVRMLEILGLTLHTSTARWAAFEARSDESTGAVLEPRVPTKPASVRDTLASLWSQKAATIDTEPQLVTVWFATNRQQVATAGKTAFANTRGSATIFGQCQVAVPKGHRFGETKPSWWRVVIEQARSLRVENIDVVPQSEFWHELSDQLQRLPEGTRQSLLYIHGYNNSFDDAATRAAQLGRDLKIPGAMAFFSWPSACSTSGYLADGATIQASEAALHDFIRAFLTESASEVVHIIAHSMGNRGLVWALDKLATEGPSEARARIGQVMFAAPDVDSDVFRRYVSPISGLADRSTLYASPGDRAVWLSREVHAYSRAGHSPPVTTVAGTDTVLVPGFDLMSLGHNYFAEAEAVLHDMFDLIR